MIFPTDAIFDFSHIFFLDLSLIVTSVSWLKWKAKAQENTCFINQILRPTFIEGSQATNINYIFLSLNIGSEILSYYSFKKDMCLLVTLFVKEVGPLACTFERLLGWV